MKNLFPFLFFLIPIFLIAQDDNYILENGLHTDITGIWQQDHQSDYYTIILFNPEKKYIFTNFSFVEQNIVIENFLEETSAYIKTVVHNPDNGWRVYCEYSFIDENTIQVMYSGDIEGRHFLYRQNIIPKKST